MPSVQMRPFSLGDASIHFRNNAVSILALGDTLGFKRVLDAATAESAQQLFFGHGRNSFQVLAAPTAPRTCCGNGRTRQRCKKKGEGNRLPSMSPSPTPIRR